MSTAKEKVRALLNRLPNDCSLEDIRYHLYVVGKVRNGLRRAEIDGTISQEKVKCRLLSMASDSI